MKSLMTIGVTIFLLANCCSWKQYIADCCLAAAGEHAAENWPWTQRTGTRSCANRQRIWIACPRTWRHKPRESVASSLIAIVTLGCFTFWISLSLRPKTETKRLNFGLRPELRLTSHRSAHHCSLHNVITDVVADISVFLCLFVNKWKSGVIFIHQNWICNWWTSLVHSKSTGELISFGFSDRSVQSLVSAKCSVNCWVQTKKRLHFLADLWSQSEFRTQRKSQQKTDPNSEMTRCI